jgi:hypothetical protein
MAAAITLFQLHGGGIHVVRPGTGVASVTEVPFPLRAGAGGEKRADHDQLKVSSIDLQRHERRIQLA